MQVDLTSKSRDELLALAKEIETYTGKLPKDLNTGDLRDAVEKGLLKRQRKLEEQAVADADLEKREKLGAKDRQKGHPSAETIAIEASRKVYATFVNVENPGSDGELGADVKCWKGEKYLFHLWDQQQHVLPECLIVAEPDRDAKLLERMRLFWDGLGLKGNHAVKQARNNLRQMSWANSAVNPRAERRYNKKEDKMVTVVVGVTPRFRFTDVSEAPADAEFGLVVKGVNDGEHSPNQSAA